MDTLVEFAWNLGMRRQLKQRRKRLNYLRRSSYVWLRFARINSSRLRHVEVVLFLRWVVWNNRLKVSRRILPLIRSTSHKKKWCFRIWFHELRCSFCVISKAKMCLMRTLVSMVVQCSKTLVIPFTFGGQIQRTMRRTCDKSLMCLFAALRENQARKAGIYSVSRRTMIGLIHLILDRLCTWLHSPTTSSSLTMTFISNYPNVNWLKRFNIIKIISDGNNINLIFVWITCYLFDWIRNYSYRFASLRSQRRSDSSKSTRRSRIKAIAVWALRAPVVVAAIVIARLAVRIVPRCNRMISVGNSHTNKVRFST